MDEATVLEVLRQVEWVEQDHYEAQSPSCPCCKGRRYGEDHRDDCKLAALLDEAEAQSPVDTVNESWEDRQKRFRRVVEMEAG